MATGIKGKFSVLQRLAFELRYKHGFNYLDRCGRTINTIQREFPEWVVRPADPNPQSAPMINFVNGCVFNFSTQSLGLTLEKPLGSEALSAEDVGTFGEQVEQLSAIVIDQLSLDSFLRMGCRAFYLFPFDTRQEADEWVLKLGAYQFSDELIKAFGGELSTASVAAVVQSDDRKFRIGFESVERSVQLDLGDAVLNVPAHLLPAAERQNQLRKQQRARKLREQNPPFAVMIDLDSFQEEPQLIEAGQFVRSSVQQGWDRLQSALS